MNIRTQLKLLSFTCVWYNRRWLGMTLRYPSNVSGWSCINLYFKFALVNWGKPFIIVLGPPFRPMQNCWSAVAYRYFFTFSLLHDYMYESPWHVLTRNGFLLCFIKMGLFDQSEAVQIVKGTGGNDLPCIDSVGGALRRQKDVMMLLQTTTA